MATFDSGDIKLRLSGGTYNKDVSLCLGGGMSTENLVSAVNNLFGKTSKNDNLKGGKRYRCFYISNQSVSVLQDFKIWVEQDDDVLSSVSLAVGVKDERQNLTFSGEIFGGTFKLKYTRAIGGVSVVQSTDQITWASSPATTAANIQSALNDLTYLSDVTVSSSFVDGKIIFTVEFAGDDGGREQMPLEITNVLLVGNDISSAVKEVQKGSPINTTADSVGFENQPPNGLTFGHASEATAVTVGNLKYLDNFAVWLLKETSPLTTVGGQQIDSCDVKYDFTPS